MGDMGDYWRDVRPAMKEESQRRRSSNRESSSRLLTEAGISFESKNEGSHLIVSGQGAVVDFWPGTGLWIVRGSKERRPAAHHTPGRTLAGTGRGKSK